MNLLLSDLVWLFLTLTVFGLWWQSMRVKERALHAVRQRCKELDLQFLDQNVALRKLSLARGENGTLQIMRRYVFEFSSTGTERYNGEITLLGPRVTTIRIEPHRLH